VNRQIVLGIRQHALHIEKIIVKPYTICGRENYVAPSEQLLWNEQTDWPGRHITTLAKGSSGMSSVSDPLASADLSCPHW